MSKYQISHIKFQISVLLLLAVFLVACRPRGILSSREMRSVLVDLHKTDALLQTSGLQHGHDETKNMYYAMVLSEHGITQAQFDSSLVWYTNHPQLFDKIYPRVLAQLAEERQEFESAHAEELGTLSRPNLSAQSLSTPRLSAEEAQMAVDSIIWTMQHGAPVYGWIPGWQRPSNQPVVPFNQ